MDFFETIERRHSVRRFTDKVVADELIERLLRVTLTAPSSKNCHSTSFFVVKERTILAAIAAMRESGSAFIAEAPCAVIVCGDAILSDLWVDNAAIAATFLQLAAVAEGLGSCWVHVNGRLRGAIGSAAAEGAAPDIWAADYLRTVISIPANLNPLCVIALGYPAPEQKFVSRAELYSEKGVGRRYYFYDLRPNTYDLI